LGSQSASDADYQVKVKSGSRIVGFTAKLRSQKQNRTEDSLQGREPSKRAIVALGLVVFEEANPICSFYPTEEE